MSVRRRPRPRPPIKSQIVLSVGDPVKSLRTVGRDGVVRIEPENPQYDSEPDQRRAKSKSHDRLLCRQTGGPTWRPVIRAQMRDTRKKTTKKKKRTRRCRTRPPRCCRNPKTAAMIAMMKKPKAHRSMAELLKRDFAVDGAKGGPCGESGSRRGSHKGPPRGDHYGMGTIIMITAPRGPGAHSRGFSEGDGGMRAGNVAWPAVCDIKR